MRDLAGSARTGTIEPTIVTFAVSDPEVLLALSEHPDGPARTNFLVTALKVGVLSLKAARGTLDSDTLRREGDRLMEELGTRLNNWRSRFEERVSGSLAHYFDPQQGTFMERVHRLTKADGDLATVVRQQVQEARTNLSQGLRAVHRREQPAASHARSERRQPAGRTLQRTLDGVVQAQNVAILGQFSLDNKDGALVRFLGELTPKHGDLNHALSRDMQAIVAEFSLDKEDSALSRLVSRVETAQRSLTAELSLDNEDSALQRLHRMLQEHHQKTMLHQQMDLVARLDTAIQSMNARREESAKSTRHGLEFESTLGRAPSRTGAGSRRYPPGHRGDHGPETELQGRRPRDHHRPGEAGRRRADRHRGEGERFLRLERDLGGGADRAHQPPGGGLRLCAFDEDGAAKYPDVSALWARHRRQVGRGRRRQRRMAARPRSWSRRRCR